MEIILFITQNGGTILAIGSAIVTAASLISSLTETPKDDNIVRKLKSLLNILALNVKHAKPIDPTDKK